ncbi:MAG: hypothetical protein RLZZ58_2114, partial [Pseudomonadota bacterium]
MIATVLRQVPGDEKGRVTAWRQLTDILAQRGEQMSAPVASRALHALAYLRPMVPEQVRKASAFSIARRCQYAPLVAFFAGDAPAIANVMLRQAPLSTADWLAYLPASSPAARAIVRERSDLDESVRRALDAFGANRMQIAGDIAAAHEPVVRVSQITELVQRIDDYRSQKKADSQPVEARGPIDSFLFEAGGDGVIFWVNGAPRGALIGLDIGRVAPANEPGVDGNAAGAFRQRGDISNARLLLEGGEAVAGEWRVSAVPWFDRVTGQFRGYRGHARRPHRHETALESGEGAGDSIRQLIHELRSPLNAISGFAQIVEAQMFGPVNQNYRSMAASIVNDAANLQQIIEDLDAAARSEQVIAAPDAGISSDLIMTLNLVARDVHALARDRGATLRLPEAAAGPRVAVAEPACRRILGRLLTALVDVASIHDNLVVEVTTVEGLRKLSVNRPAAIADCSEANLLDPGFSPSGDAPAASVLSL